MNKCIQKTSLYSPIYYLNARALFLFVLIIIMRKSIQREHIDWVKRRSPLYYESAQASSRVQHLLHILRVYEKYTNAHFQSMIAVGLDSGEGETVNEKIMDYLVHLSGEISQTSLEDISEEYYYSCIGNMIGNEMGAASDDYYVFYRIVGTKLMFYELNTLMISIFSDNSHHLNFNKNHGYDAALPLICTHSLIDDTYPCSIADVISLFNSNISDDTQEMNEILLSANNCLEIFPNIRNSFYIRPHHHSVEASPLNFFEGYEGSSTWKKTMREFLIRFFELSLEDADALIGNIKRLYYGQYTDDYEDDMSHSSTTAAAGHCIQIFVPKEHACKFAYSSFAWGHPASVFALSGGEHVAQHRYDVHRKSFSAPPPNSEDILNFHEIMSSEDMAKVQTRIIGHPNLYLQHGGFTKVISGNPRFDRKTFQDGLQQLLAPLISKALTQGKRLTYSKFTNDDVIRTAKHKTFKQICEKFDLYRKK